MGEGLRVLSHLKGTTDEKIDAIARDVNVELNQGVNNLGEKANKLVKDVKAETAEMRKIIESAEFGIPAPSLASMTAVSDEAGINVTVTATDATVDFSDDKAVLATTKGVMVRYKDGSYPTNKTDGELAFIDEDLITVDTNGNRVAKAKTHLVVGLTKDHTYYFSAFPYTQQGAHNERLGTGNVAKCKWSGTKGSCTVNVTQDYDYKPLGDFTVTLTPKSAGTQVEKTQTGAGKVIFGNLEAGVYTVSFSDTSGFMKPQNEDVTITAGINVSIGKQYCLITKLADLTWDDIHYYASKGVSKELFTIGDVTAPFTVRKFTPQMTVYEDAGPLTTTAKLVHIYDDGRCVFVTMKSAVYHSDYTGGYAQISFSTTQSDFVDSINSNYATIFPSSINKYMVDELFEQTETTSSKTLYFAKTLKLCFPTERSFGVSDKTYKVKYDYFVSNERRRSLDIIGPYYLADFYGGSDLMNSFIDTNGKLVKSIWRADLQPFQTPYVFVIK